MRRCARGVSDRQGETCLSEVRPPASIDNDRVGTSILRAGAKSAMPTLFEPGTNYAFRSNAATHDIIITTGQGLSFIPHGTDSALGREVTAQVSGK
jgi:hypothetical protein